MNNNIKFFVVCFLVTISFFNVNAQEGYGKTDIADLALIYQGGVHRSAYKWTKDKFAPYVVHEDLKGKKNWLFDGFLFLEFKDGKGRNYAPGYDKLNARKTEWEWLMDQQFAKDTAFSALNEAISDQIEILGKPHFKHKLVVGMPSPILNQKDWGSINGKSLDFTKWEDRIEAGKWFVDEFLKRYENENYNHLKLSGFYWVDEDIRGCADILEPIGDYIRSKGYRFYWIPYWKAQGYDQWRELKFDFAWLQPNHFFNDEIEDTRIDQACELARKLGMGMEMEFDDRALVKTPNSKRSRLAAYTNAFIENKVFDESSIAYYQGGDALYKLAKSTDLEDRKIIDELAKKIIERKKKKKYKRIVEK